MYKDYNCNYNTYMQEKDSTYIVCILCIAMFNCKKVAKSNNDIYINLWSVLDVLELGHPGTNHRIM